MPEETSWRYVYKRPDLIEEIITNNQGIFDLASRTMRLIELVEYGARVDRYPTDSDVDQRAIKLEYSSRANSALTNLVENELVSFDIFFNYLMEHWDKEAVLEVAALISIFKSIDLSKYTNKITASLYELVKSMVVAGAGSLLYDAIESLVYIYHSDKVQKIVEQYLLELLNNPDYDRWILEAMENIQKPTTLLVDRVVQLSNPDYYDESKQLADMPEKRKRTDPFTRDLTNTEYIPDDILLDTIRRSNFERLSLSRHLLEVWNIGT